MSKEVMKNTEACCNGCAGCVKLPEEIQLRQWVDCDECWCGKYQASQRAYWCSKFGGYDSRGGCSFGDPR